MKRAGNLLWLGACAAVGSAIGVMANPKESLCGGIVGAAAGIVAGSIFSGIYETDTEGKIKYYTKSLPLYENSDEVGYI